MSYEIGRPLKVLFACEISGKCRDAFRRLGHEAWSCDLLGPDDYDMRNQEYANYHLEGDFRWFIDGSSGPVEKWDMIIGFPPCTYLCSSGLHWNKRRPDRALETEKALELVRAIDNAPCDKTGFENPVGCISTRIRKPSQIIQPYDFGEDASKQTCLWLKGLPLLIPTRYTPPRWVCVCGHTTYPNEIKKADYPLQRCAGCGEPMTVKRVKRRWGNQTDSGQNKLPPSENRAAERGETYSGIANAMAQQWGGKCTP